MQNDRWWRLDGLLCSIRREISQSLIGRFFGHTSTVQVGLNGCAVQAKAINGYADHVMVLKRIKQTVKNACVDPTPHSGVNRVPLAKTWRQGPPFAAIFGDKKDGIDYSKV